MKNINLIAFGTFGSPNGFTQTFFSGSLIKGIRAFDIRGGIKIFPQSTVYSIRKESIESSNILSYSIYTFAKKQLHRGEVHLLVQVFYMLIKFQMKI
ncbi:MAG: hypothetical protein IPO37_04900 [Saprospiraceae bacterium]|nr:hypothetical protein [Saprospiraceae bacterium]